MSNKFDTDDQARNEAQNALADDCKALLKKHAAIGLPTENILSTMALVSTRFTVALHGMETGLSLIELLSDNLRTSPVDPVDSL